MWPPFWPLVSLSPHHPFRKCFPSLKGEGPTQPHVRLQLTDVHKPLRAERAEVGPAVTGGTPPRNNFLLQPSVPPLGRSSRSPAAEDPGGRC